MKTAIVVSASSGIGEALCRRWSTAGMWVVGTYRSRSKAVAGLVKDKIPMVPCDLSSKRSVAKAGERLGRLCPVWDVMVLCPGSLDPIGPFAQCDFDEWENSVTANFTAQLRLVRALLASRRRGSDAPSVLFFAGGGTNNAPVNYSAYTVSKIALIKMCEILDKEVPDTRFVIVGPGWVKTKIHQTTLKAGDRAGENYERTKERLRGGDFVPMDRVLDCCDWLLSAPRGLVGGRNFSVASDGWGTEALKRRLAKEPNLYKLRRFGNEAPAGAPK